MKCAFSQTAAQAFAETLEQLDLDGTCEELRDPVALGHRAALLVLAERLWAQHFGPLLEVEQVRILLNIGTPQAVSDLEADGQLLALKGRAGRKLFPAFQFGTSDGPLAGVPEVLDAFAGAALSPYTVASWLVAPQPLLGGNTPAAWLRSGGDLDLVLEAARRDAAPLSH